MANAKQLGLPTKPAKIVLTKQANGRILLTWRPQFSTPDSAVASKYRVWRRPNSGTPFVKLGETTNLSYTDQSPLPGNSQYEITPVW